MRNQKVMQMIFAALLCAIGIIIPMFSPFKIVIPPASYTLGSHIPIMIAMFISPPVAVAVCLGTTAGFFLGGFPLVIVLRAATHLIFALIGAIILKINPQILKKPFTLIVFGVFINIIHGICEAIIVTPLYIGGSLTPANYTNGWFISIILLVGIGTVINGFVDYLIAIVIWKALHISNVFQPHHLESSKTANPQSGV